MMTTNNRTRLAVSGLFLGALLFLAVNIFSNSTFKAVQLDLTEGKLFTLSDGTRKVLSKIDEPIKMRLFFSKILGEQSPQHATYFTRVKELLGQYANISGGKVVLELHDPEPFSDAEDLAVSFGLQGVPVNAQGDLGYLGLGATNSTDDQEVIAFLTPARETFLEYDLTRLVYSLANPTRKTVGLLSALPINGKPGPQVGGNGRWTVINQINEFFGVTPIQRDATSIPDDIDLLMIVHPKGVNEEMLYAIDQFVLKGGRVMAFVDTNAETAARPGAGQKNDPVSEFDKTLESWGVRLVKDQVAADITTARRVNVQQGAKLAVTDYVAWLALKPENFDSEDIATADLQVVNIGTSGILEPIEGKGTVFSPLMQTSDKSMQINRDKVMLRPQVVELFRNFKPQNKRLTLAARITGKAKSAFPDKTKTNPDHIGEAVAPINIIVVADTDMLSDGLWVDMEDMGASKNLVPFASNADFVINALDNLGGSEDLIGLRARSRTPRAFDLVHNIRQAAEIQYRTKEQELQDKLIDVRSRLNKLMRREETTGEMVLNSKEKELVEEFRGQMTSIRKQLRDVQHALRSDIDRLDTWLKFFNIAAIPVLLGIGILIGALLRRFRRIPVAQT
jgi:ABC-type uncharacterized transport system involved in gliding motility auxiliary subunit